MIKIHNQGHSANSLLFAFSRLLERAAYYGFRALIVLYMISETINLSNTKAISVYGMIATGILFSSVLGGLLGDLIKQNKLVAVIGGVIQALGVLVLCFQSELSLYIGIAILVLGNGLFSPNVIALFGKSYLEKPKLLDAGFNIFYLAINVGAMIGTIVIALVGENHGWNYGFILAALFSLMSLVPLWFAMTYERFNDVKVPGNLGIRFLVIIGISLLIGLFWNIFEMSGMRMFQVQQSLSEITTLNLPTSFWSSINSIFILPLGIILIIIWSLYYNSPFIKVGLGFIFAALAYTMLFTIPDSPGPEHLIFYFIFMFFITLAELLVSPTILAIVTKYSNPKYLAIIISIVYFPMRGLMWVTGFFTDALIDNPEVPLISGIVVSGVVGLFVLGGLFIIKNQFRKSTI